MPKGRGSDRRAAAAQAGQPTAAPRPDRSDDAKPRVIDWNPWARARRAAPPLAVVGVAAAALYAVVLTGPHQFLSHDAPSALSTVAESQLPTSFALPYLGALPSPDHQPYHAEAEPAVAVEAPIAVEAAVVVEAPVAVEITMAVEAPVAVEAAVVAETTVVAAAPVAVEAPVVTEVPVTAEPPVAAETPVMAEAADTPEAATAIVATVALALPERLPESAYSVWRLRAVRSYGIESLGGITLPIVENRVQQLFDTTLEGAPVRSVAALSAHFDGLQYRLSKVRVGGDLVPRHYLVKLPPDIAEIDSVDVRKRFFIKAVLPVVLRVNEDILAERDRLKQLRAQAESGATLDQADVAWLTSVARRYGCKRYDWEELLRRVDMIPPSLAIAQAATESGWGTSRFALEGNALFGEHTNDPKQGMAPIGSKSPAKFHVRAFPNLLENVRSYAHNLNQHRAYPEFRAQRAKLRAANKRLDGHALAGGLELYSERGLVYIKLLRRIIGANDLSYLDDARLPVGIWTQVDERTVERRS